MRYDAEKQVIDVDFKELVSIARRGVAPSLSYDEDEPSVSTPSERRLRSLIGDASRKILSYVFEKDGFTFALHAMTDDAKDGRITVAREIESSPSHPKKQESAEIRGEGYIAAYIFASEEGLSSVDIRFIYMNASSGEVNEVCETVSRARLASFFDRCVGRTAIYARPEIERVTERLPSLKKMKFPYASVREGQDEFIRAAYRTLARGGVLYASAPTGTGKTASALYPALRALGDGRVEKVFYLTPKTTTASVARECLEKMAEVGAKIRAVILSAKERCCEKGLLCRRSRALCENSRENHIADAVMKLYSLGLTSVSIDEARDVAKEFTVCPYELLLTYSELCDTVICDINYLFDPTVYIRRFFTDGGKYAFLIDEAHNLPERAREMYSDELREDDFDREDINALLGELSRVKKMLPTAKAVFKETLLPYVKEELREDKDGELYGATTLSEVPSRLYSLFDEMIRICEDEIFDNRRAADDEKDARLSVLRDFYYKTKKFSDILARFDNSYKMFIYYDAGKIRVRLCCIDTGGVIRERLSKGFSALFFSATLSPLNYYRAVLGGTGSDETLEVRSPFSPEQLSVAIMDKISTRYSEREDTRLAVCRAIAATVSAKRGNYMVFSPSFAYSEALAKTFSSMYPKLNVILQTKNMSAGEKADFLAKFHKDDSSYLIAFCVMGGIYSEGIDLTGDRLIGAVIVGIGMPQISYEREAIAEYYQERYEEGKQFAYIYPGMNRVFQAAGRVIRTETDRGVIVLIDDRFDDPIYKESLPELWSGIRFIDSAKRLKEITDEFWRDNK